MFESRPVRIFVLITGIVFLCLAAVVVVLIARFQPVAREYVLSALHERYNSEVELGNLQISLFPVVRATGENLVLHFEGRRDIPPVIKVRRFTLEARFIGFFRNPKRIRRLKLEGLEIHAPPHTDRSGDTRNVRVPFILEEVVADGATLETSPKNKAKEPLTFAINELTMHSVGLGQAMTFHARVTNPKPPGFIHSDGQFGPWNRDNPSDTPLSGKYTFRDADLSVFKGIRGTLSSDGQYKGLLSRIEVRGTADVPGFALKMADHPVPLHTEFQATVDGGDGDTILHPVRARLGRSVFEVSGSIDRHSLETHKTIQLEARTGANGGGTPLEDFLRLSVRSPKPPMTGTIRFNTKVKIPPGEADVADRMQLDGDFSLNGVRFTSADVQRKIASLSHHAEGKPKDNDPNVSADFKGRFHLRDGRLALPDLEFELPGAQVNLTGSYTLKGGALDFTGKARLQATVSQMTTGYKRILLKAVDPLFKRDGAGAVVPIRISGTRGDPSFRLDIGKILKP